MQLWLSNVLTEKGSTSIDALYRRSRKSNYLRNSSVAAQAQLA